MKKIIMSLRWAVIIVISYLIVFGKGRITDLDLGHAFILFYIFSNLALIFLPPGWFANPKFFYSLVVFDTGLIALGMYLSEKVTTDFYLVFFFIIIFASLSRNYKLLIIISGIIASLYGLLLLSWGLLGSEDAASYILRIPFVFIMAVFYGYIVQTFTKEKQQQLAISEDKYRGLFENAHDGIIILRDDQFVIADINREAERLIGYEKAELLNKSFIDLLGHMEEAQRFLDGVHEKGEAETDSLSLFKKDGTPLEVDLAIKRIDLGNESFYQVIFRDLTERRIAEQVKTLRESEERYRNLVETSPDVIVLMDLDYKILICSHQAAVLFGHEGVGEAVGRSIFEFLDPKDHEHLLGDMQKVLKTGTLRNIEYSFLRKNGTRFPGEISVSLTLDAEGKPKAFIKVLRDITDRKRAEKKMADLQEQLRQSQRMEAIGQLAGGVAHDFNNLLTVITGYNQLSLLEVKEDSSLRINAEAIGRASEKATGLIRQLLAFSRHQVMEIKVIDLNVLITNLDKMLRRVIGEDIELTIQLAEDLGRVKTDPGQIDQVILNLAVNARDAMPSGGKLTIETANKELDEEYAQRHVAVKPGRYVMFSVSDTGVGMTPEARNRAFEPFFTTKEVSKGTGLGLSTAYGIVKQSEGNIWVYSEPGRGTTFKIYLPLVDEPLKEMSETVLRKESPRGKETILIVEDQEEVRRLAVQTLRRQGYTVFEASHGEEAMRIAQEHVEEGIDFLLTDVVMPGMSGRELVKKLGVLLPKMKVLYMSGYTDGAIARHGVLEEGVNYLQKPFTLDSLAWKVREVLDQ